MTLMQRLAPGLLFAAVCALGLLALRVAAESGETDGRARRLDAIFAPWHRLDTPGCVVGTSRGEVTLAVRGYGMADLEHDVRNTPETIFEAGSVSKQFTATAVWLLASEGRLSLDDPARRYVPELPDYGAPLTIRQMLTHTSGLRDWGDIAAISGWPRTSRAYTHAHVLEIVSRQRALNFPSGNEYSYSNTGYNLAAILVSRVTGRNFADFTSERIFQPLGMTHTSWRDDHTRIVKNRAVAYARTGGRYTTLMPFEDVHGNGGLLTTVGDLLTWNRNLARPHVGGPSLVHDLEQPARLNDGREIPYGLGLRLGTYRGLREVGHAGATAGYRAYLTRFPEEDLSIALLCNAGDVDTTQIAHRVADVFLRRASAPVPDPARVDGSTSSSRIEIGAGACTPPCDGGADGRATPSATISASRDLLGRYRSDEADAEWSVTEDQGALVVRSSPDGAWPVKWIKPDTFATPLGAVRILRADDGRITGLSLATARVYDLRFSRVN